MPVDELSYFVVEQVYSGLAIKTNRSARGRDWLSKVQASSVEFVNGCS